jgi:hypothetical protein
MGVCKCIRMFFVTIIVFLQAYTQASDQAGELLKLNEVIMYNPVRFGLRDFVVHIRIEELTKILNDKMIFGKLEDVSFKLYWSFPDKAFVEVLGLPAGFKEVKAQLQSLIFNRLDFIVPRTLATSVKGFKSKILGSAAGGEKKIQFIDPTGLHEVREVVMTMKNTGPLSALVTVGALQSEQATFQYITLPCSQNKQLLESYKVKSTSAMSGLEVDHNIQYELKNGFCFPSTITSVTKQFLYSDSGKRLNEQQRDLITTMQLTGHEINTGTAMTFFKKLK